MDAAMTTSRGLKPETLCAILGFVGNELLTPMNRSGIMSGLDPAFWADAPLPGNEHGRRGLERLLAYAQTAAQNEAASGGIESAKVPGALQASVEFAHLFIGPPKPAALPWETMNDPANERHVGYGRATVLMKELLAEEGLEVSNENRQYEDHMGIELLYLSVLCEKAATDAAYARKATAFAGGHPLRWMPELRAAVDAERPRGYYSALLEYAQGLLEQLAAQIA